MTRTRIDRLSPEARKVFLWMKTLRTGYAVLALYSLKPAALAIVGNLRRGISWWDLSFTTYEICQCLIPLALLAVWILLRHHFGGYMAAMVLAAEFCVSTVREPGLLNGTGIVVCQALVILMCWSAGTCQKKLRRTRQSLPRIYSSIIEEIREAGYPLRHGSS